MKKPDKVSLTKEASQSLESMVFFINENFKEGKLTKQTLASWIIQKYQKKYFDKSVQEIRETHRDPIRVLESQLAELKAAKKQQKP